MTSSQLRGAVLETLVDSARPRTIRSGRTANELVALMQSDGLMPPRADGGSIAGHLADLRELRYALCDDSTPRRWQPTAEGIRVVAHARAVTPA